MNNFGVDVTIVEFLDRMVPTEDADVSKELAKHYKKLGVKVLTRHQGRVGRGHRLRRPRHRGPGRRRPAGARGRPCSSQAIGFAPRTEGYGLENTGVKVTERGAIEIDDFMRTNVPGVYAIGDCTAKLMLAHVAEARASSPPRPSPAPRPCRSTTT
jgi:dihydrolipoamide dehydrogenase